MNPMFYDDDHLDYPGPVDYEAQDAADREEELTWQERSFRCLANHPEFPGSCADGADCDAFATELRRASQRRVPCQFGLGGMNVRGKFAHERERDVLAACSACGRQRKWGPRVVRAPARC
jgi:hypothetical protein